MLGCPVEAGGDDPPPFTSATEAYRQGASSLKSGQAAAIAAGARICRQARRARRAAQAGAHLRHRPRRRGPGRCQGLHLFPADRRPAGRNQPVRSPIAKYAAEAFVALGQYYVDGIPAMPLAPNPSYAADLFRHAASYFGSAEAQYRLARLYMNGEGVEKNVGLAVNWLATAAKKQHAASQATLGEILWRGAGRPPAAGEGPRLDHPRA